MDAAQYVNQAPINSIVIAPVFNAVLDPNATKEESSHLRVNAALSVKIPHHTVHLECVLESNQTV